MALRCLSDHGTSDWGELTRGQSPLADAAWFQCGISAFGASGERTAFHTVHDDSRFVAGIPLVRSENGLARMWTSLDNEHHPYCLIPGALDVTAAERVLEHLLEDTDYVYLRRLPMHDPSCLALVKAARHLGMPVSQLQSDAGDTRIVLERSWDEFRARLPKNFQRDLPRKQRQLEKMGHLTYAEHTVLGPELDAALAECFDVETRGWKGTEGSPINRDPRTLRFYGEVARAMAATGRFTLYTLSLDDRIIAFEYSLRGGGHIEMLKLSYDPAFAAQSPGQVLRMLLLQRELERGGVRYYHLGRPSEWKLRWATEVAPLCTLRIYGRNPRARAAHLLGPVLRGRLKQSPVLVKLHDRLRGVRP